MQSRNDTPGRLYGHTLMELVVAMAISTVLLAGLGSVMLIGRQVAYTPSAATMRIAAAEVVNQIAEELRCATLVVQQSPLVLEFVVADRDGDGAAERIRYEWSGTAGDPLYKRINTAAAVAVLDSIENFEIALQTKTITSTLTSTTTTAEMVLAGNTNTQNLAERDITPTNFFAQQINPLAFASIPANAISWNATQVEFFGLKAGNATETLIVQLRHSGAPRDIPTSNVLGQTSVAESELGSGASWKLLSFPTPVTGLSLSRKYNLVWMGVGGAAAKIVTNDLAASGLSESTDAGSSWQTFPTSWLSIPNRQVFYRIYGTYSVPGTSYSVTRNYVSQVRLTVQASDKTHGRIDASVPLIDSPELLSSYWRADFEDNPVISDVNGDAVADWALADGGTFDAARLVGGAWYASGVLQTQPANDFTTATTIEVRCRNSSVGGNGAVMRINADRSGGQHAPLMVSVQRHQDATQSLTLSGKSAVGATVILYSCQKLPADFIRFRLTILPQHNAVNLRINDEEQGTYVYTTCAASSSTERNVALYADTSLAEFDYVDVRVAAQ